MTFDLRTFEIVRIEATTYDGNKLRGGAWAGELYGDRYRRVQAHRRNLQRIFDEVDPVVIACEIPFFNASRPNAFEALVEVVLAIQEAMRIHNPWMFLMRVSPSEVKNAVGAKGGSGKTPVKDALEKRPDVCAKIVGTIASLDEHAIDATGVALFALSNLKTHLGAA